MNLIKLHLVLLCLAALQGECAQLSDEDKLEILKSHNSFRADVDPPASNMQELAWSDQLAEVASNYADLCIWGHNSQSETSQSTFSSVGENIYLQSGGSFQPSAVVNSWNNEVKDYSYENGTCSKVCGHYTQVVWATTTHVGCGMAICPRIEGLSWKNVQLVVCNYGPAGNYRGKRPYQEGTPCSRCSDATVCKQNLCSMMQVVQSNTTAVSEPVLSD